MNFKFSFKLSKFLVNTLINHNIYLGYALSQTHMKMSFYLLGLKNNVSIHDLSHTFLVLKKIMKIADSTWYNYGTMWMLFPKNPSLNPFLQRNILMLKTLRKNLYFWTHSWLPGFLRKVKKDVASLIRKDLRYPNYIFYLQYTNNEQKISEAFRNSIMHAFVKDTNSPAPMYAYNINSNETTYSSNVYYSKLMLNACIFHKKFKKKLFII